MPEAWLSNLTKIKSSMEFILSGLRMIDVKQVPAQALAGSLDTLGQPLFRAPSPKGWPDTASD